MKIYKPALQRADDEHQLSDWMRPTEGTGNRIGQHPRLHPSRRGLPKLWHSMVAPATSALLAPTPPNTIQVVAIARSGMALEAMKAAKMLIVECSWIRSGIEILVVGEPAEGVAYQVGPTLAGLCA
jgi:hypothetical protein